MSWIKSSKKWENKRDLSFEQNILVMSCQLFTWTNGHNRLDDLIYPWHLTILINLQNFGSNSTKERWRNKEAEDWKVQMSLPHVLKSNKLLNNILDMVKLEITLNKANFGENMFGTKTIK